MKKLLFCHRGALGDFILCFPALRLLKTNFKNCHFIGIGRPEYLRLAREFSLCDEIFNCESAIFTDFFETGRIPESIYGIDAAILWLNDASILSSALKDSSVKILSIRPFVNNGIHTGMRYFNDVSTFFFPRQNYNIEDTFTDADTSSSGTANILIHPGSGSLKKNMPPDFYLALGKLIEQKGIKLNYIFGPVEIERKEYLHYPEEKRVFSLDPVSLKDHIIRTSLFIGNDSGPSHLAAFCGIKTVAIFADSSSAIWRPLGKNVIVLDNPKIKFAEEFLSNLCKQKFNFHTYRV